MNPRPTPLVPLLGRALLGATLLAALLPSTPAHAAGSEMFRTAKESTGEKPQSKLWYHAGSYWCILKGPSGTAFYHLTDGAWHTGEFADSVLAPAGNADVKCVDDTLFVLLYEA